MNNNIFQHNSSCVLGVTFSLTLEKVMVGDLGKSLCLKKYWFCSLRKETLVSYYIVNFCFVNQNCSVRIRSMVQFYMKVRIHHAPKMSNMNDSENESGKHNRKMFKDNHF